MKMELAAKLRLGNVIEPANNRREKRKNPLVAAGVSKSCHGRLANFQHIRKLYLRPAFSSFTDALILHCKRVQ